VSRATGRALSTPSLSTPHCARATRAACGRRPCLTAGQAGSGPRCPGLYSAVAGPQQAELGFGTEAVYKLKIPFIFFI
jgi:hypothetical protein